MRKTRLLLVLFCGVFIAACAGPQAARTTGSQRPAPVTIQQHKFATQLSIIGTARNMLGTPYRYGGANPQGFDCSGLVSYAYRSAGIRVPRTSGEQYRQAEKIPLHQLRAGDLLFFRLRPPKVSHVAIYDRNGRFIHAPSSGKRVSYASLDNPFWRQHLVAAGRF